MKTEEIIKIFTTPLKMFSFLFYSQAKQFVYNKIVTIVVSCDNTSKIQRANDSRLFTSRAVHLFTFPSHAQGSKPGAQDEEIMDTTPVSLPSPTSHATQRQL